QDFRPLRRERFLSDREVRKDVPKILVTGRFAYSVQGAGGKRLSYGLPDSRKVGLAVNSANRAGHVDFAVGCPRSPRSAFFPLGLCRNTKSQKRDSDPDNSLHGIVTLNYKRPAANL